MENVPDEAYRSAEVVIGAVTNKKQDDYILAHHWPFHQKRLGEHGSGMLNGYKTQLVYFTNSNELAAPRLWHVDEESSFRTAQVRYILTVRYVAACWPAENLKWF